MKRQQHARARRRVVMRVGFAALALASATACIFEKGSYDGGGRVDKGGEAKTIGSASSSSSSTPTPSTDGSSGTDPFADAGAG